MSVAKLGSAVLGEMSLSIEGGVGGAVLGLAVLGEMQLSKSDTPKPDTPKPDDTPDVAKRMMNYLPQYWHDIVEMKQILRTNGIEFDTLRDELKIILSDAFIMSSSEKRISEWENALKLAPIGTLHERRVAVLQFFAVNLKLSSTVIKSLVASIYDDARAYVEFDDSEIKILIIPLPEHASDELDFSLLLKQLEMRKPCHIGLNVERFMCSWQDVRDGRLRTWDDFKNNLKTWNDVLMYIPR